MEDKEIYLKKIKISKVRNICDLDIKLGDETKRHLILTGKNGSGKTSVLLAIKLFLDKIASGEYRHYSSQKQLLHTLQHQLQELQKLSSPNNDDLSRISRITNEIKTVMMWFSTFGGLELDFGNPETITDKFYSGQFLVAYFDSKRTSSLVVPTGINKVDLKTVYGTSEKANSVFIQYIVNLKATRSFARDDGDNEEVHRIDVWFNKFESRLRVILEDESLKLVFDRKEYNFFLESKDKEPFRLSELSDGFSAIFSIVTELILRMESTDDKGYGLQGLVLIDEIETHLHVGLQKKILPFLIDFFPNIQFVITTHSPFVLQSISSAVICDLQSRAVVEDLSGYSYSLLVESYFHSDKYSEEIKQNLNIYEELSKIKQKTSPEKYKYKKLNEYFKSIPKNYAQELEVKIQQIKLEAISKGLE